MEHPSAANLAAWSGHLGIAEDRVDPDDLRSRLSEGTLPEALRQAAEDHPSSTLAVDDELVTLRELHEEVSRQVVGLADLGVEHGDRVVFSTPSSLGLVVGYLAVLGRGATAVLANPAYTDGELRGTARRANACLVVCDRTLGEVESGTRVVGPTELAKLGDRSGQPDPAAYAVTESDDVALLAFTSGTTGEPKGVPLTHAHLLSSIRGAMWAWRWQPSDRLVHTLPLFHQHGLSGVHATLAAGSSATVMSKFDAPRLLAHIAEQEATILFGVPAIHRRLLELDREELAPLRRLRVVTSGSGPLPPALAHDFHAATGVRLLERYGLTESGLDVSNLYDGERVPGRVGTPLPGVEVDLRTGDGTTVPRGESGEIVLRGPQVFDGYLDDPEATDSSFWSGGWFRTGDLGKFDDGGRLQITGRLKEIVITGGMNVAPPEVEGVIEQLPEVDEAAVAGLPSEQWGEEVAAWVVPTGGATIDPGAVTTHCREQLAPYKCPKLVFAVAELPRNALGKVVRSALRPPDSSS